MKKYLIYIIMIFSIFIIPNRVNASGMCDNRLLVDYRDLASNINVYTSYRMVDGKPVFDVTFTNIYEDIYIVDETNNKTYKYKDFSSDTELIIKGYSANQRITYKIYMSATGCYGNFLGTRYVTLPNYNEYATDPVCVGAEEYSLCQRWGVTSGTYESFVAQVTEYKEKKNATVIEEETVEKESTWKDIILRFIGNYYVYMVSCIILIVLLLAALKSTSLRKNQFNFKV